MADNVAITAGSGTSIATDDVGGVHYQRVKLVDGTLDGTGAIGGDATNGLDVDVTRLPALPAGTNNIGDVDVLSIAAGDNNIGNVDIVTVPAPLSTAGNGTAATAHRVTIASDSTGQVTLAAGSAAIGKLAANSGVDIGDVDVTTVTPGTGATNLGKAEDAAHSTGDVGVMVLGIRDDTLSVFSGAENDYEPFHMTAAGRLYVSATVDAALPAGTNNIGDVDVLSIAAGDNNIGNVDIVTVPAPLSTAGNGTAATAHRVTIASDSTGQVVLAAGSAAIGKLAANSGVDIGDVDVTTVTPGTAAANLGKAEDAAHASGDTGVMALAVRKDTAAALAGTDGDYAALEVDANGRLHVLNLPFERTITVVTGTAASSGDNSLIAAPGVGVKIVVCGFVIQNESSTATTLILRDGTTSKIRCYAKNQGDGLSQVFTPDARWKLTANTALNLNLSGANTCGYTVWYYTE